MTNLDYLYNPDSSCVFFNGNYFVDKNLGFQIIEHGVILPHSIRRIRNELTDLGGIIDGNGKYVTSSSLYYGINEVYTPSQKQSIVVQKPPYIWECFIIHGSTT